MSTIGNILWFLFGGLIGGLAWVLAGCLWCITIIGIPVGLQCFKFASLAFFPFGKEVVYGGGGFSFLVNLIWIIRILHSGLSLVHHDPWHSNRKAMLQNGQAVFNALRGIGRVKQYCMRPLPLAFFQSAKKATTLMRTLSID